LGGADGEPARTEWWCGWCRQILRSGGRHSRRMTNWWWGGSAGRWDASRPIPQL